MSSPIFTSDWFTFHINKFEKFLRKFENTGEFLEIGSFEGRSALWMLENIHPARMVCIEPGYQDCLKLFRENLKDHVVELIEKPNHLAWQDYIFDKFDFVYVDANHSSKFCYFDMILGWTVLKTGGIMAVDDYLWELKSEDGTSPKEGVDRFLRENHNYYLLHKGYQIWLQKN